MNDRRISLELNEGMVPEMNKVLVVDDEKLVRQGIITTFPWERYGFVVAGEAANGERALELLELEEIDLLVTDLAMNGMSGLELIKRVREAHGSLPVVVLTCHDNFSYIQEAMRLGVLDYIVKTEIEEEAVEDTLSRIASKLAGTRAGSGASNGGARPVAEEPTEWLLLCGPVRTSSPEELGLRSWAGRLTEIDAATWLFHATRAEMDGLAARVAEAGPSGRWTCVRVIGIREEEKAALPLRLRTFRRCELFYRPAVSMETRDWAEMAELGSAAEEEKAAIRGEWHASGWIYGDAAFEALLARTAASRMDREELGSILYPVSLEWGRLLGAGVLPAFIDLSGTGIYWQEWEGWLRSFRRAIRQTVSRNSSRQTTELVLHAIELMREAIDSEAREAEIAQAVNMSRGHFSKTFKKVTGKSYGEYARLLKLERAKETLLRTDEPIARVAEMCGFSDYRHFSRVFRDYTGMLPNEFRKAGSGIMD